MKVITLKQPCASLIAEGIKRYEIRSWKTNYRGKLLIHAGSGINKEEFNRNKDLNIELPASRIVAIADLTDCILVNDEFLKEIGKETNFTYIYNKEVGYAWKLENIKKINYDKEVKGQLGLWNYDIDLDDLNN